VSYLAIRYVVTPRYISTSPKRRLRNNIYFTDYFGLLIYFIIATKQHCSKQYWYWFCQYFRSEISIRIDISKRNIDPPIIHRKMTKELINENDYLDVLDVIDSVVGIIHSLPSVRQFCNYRTNDITVPTMTRLCYCYILFIKLLLQ